MSWQESINPTTAVWRGVEAYAAERIQELTDVCFLWNPVNQLFARRKRESRRCAYCWSHQTDSC